MQPPILDDKRHAEPSAFTPDNLLREARRQKSLPIGTVPRVCVLDPDADILRDVVATGRARTDPAWACYHTELFVSGCEVLLSIASAGQIKPVGTPPYFILIDRAIRDEGTSYHYLPPARYAEADPNLLDAAELALAAKGLSVERGSTWTTDAPFRETAATIVSRREEGVLAVEMEAAALYSFANARGKNVLCFAHVTNQMALTVGDFEKGEANGARDALRLIDALVGVIDRLSPPLT